MPDRIPAEDRGTPVRIEEPRSWGCVVAVLVAALWVYSIALLVKVFL
jgi:hypothetical protein